MSQSCLKLSQTSPVWAKLVALWAEYVAHALWTVARRSKGERRPSTPLTQQHRHEAKDRRSFEPITLPKLDRVCRRCGKKVGRSDQRYCAVCVTAVMRENFDAGRKAGQHHKSIMKRSTTQRKHKQAIDNWKKSDLPSWLTRSV
jgi:hypothetical protein